MNVQSEAIAIVLTKRNNILAEREKREKEILSLSEYAELINDFSQEMNKMLKQILKSTDNEERSRLQLRIEQTVENNELEVKKILINHSYPANYLDQYYCEKCKDKADLNGGETCECLEKERNRLFAQKLNKSSALSTKFTFHNVNLEYYGKDKVQMGCIFEFCKNYAEKFDTGKSMSLLMTGRTGLGKTHFSISIANEIIQKGYSVVYKSVTELFGQIEEEHFSDKDKKTETLDIITSVDLLIIDDLGVELDNKFYKAKLHEILEKRINSGKPIIINTNLDFSEISQKYGERVASRLSVFVMLKFVGNDIRQMKNLGGI